jgi:hypothetical protein
MDVIERVDLKNLSPILKNENSPLSIKRLKY